MLYQAGYLTIRSEEHLGQLAGKVKHPFNEYLKIIVEYGFIGCIVIIIGIVLIFRGRESVDPFSRSLKMSLLVVAICALFSYPLNYPSICCLVFIECGLLVSQKEVLSLFRLQRYRILCVCISICLIVLINCWQKKEYRWNQLSRDALTGMDVLSQYSSLYPFMQNNMLFLYNYGAVLNKWQQWNESILLDVINNKM